MSAFLYCPDCATPYATLQWPRSCARCGSVHEDTKVHTAPQPPARAPGVQTLLSDPPEILVVPLIRVLRERERDGVLGIQGENGEWMLPWTVVRFGEQVEIAAARGVEDVCGISTDPYTFQPAYSRLAPGGKVLLFCNGPKIPESLLEEARLAPGFVETGVLDVFRPPSLPLQARAVLRFLRPPIALGGLAGLAMLPPQMGMPAV